MTCNCQEIADRGKQKVEESLAMKLLQDTQKSSKRWFAAWLVTFFALLTVLGGIAYIALTSDITTTSVDVNAESGIANYVGDNNDGDFDNGTNTSKKN